MKKRKHSIDESRAARIGKRIASVFLCLYTLIAVGLIGNTILSSVKTKPDLLYNTWGFPKTFTLDHYKFLLTEEHFFRYFFNSTALVCMGLLLVLITSSMVAYALSRFEFKGRSFLQTYFLIGLMFPIQLGILPLFIIFTRLHLNNTLPGLALLYAANISFPVFVFSKFFRGIPSSLSESARIDGAGELSVFVRIILPLSKPVIFTIGLIIFVEIWNDFFMPLVFLTKTNVRTLTLLIYTYMSDFLRNWDLVFAGTTLALLPVLVVYFLFSDQIVAGLTGGAVKE